MKSPGKASADGVTDPAVYFNRRNFLGTGILAASAVTTGFVYRRLNHMDLGTVPTARIEGLIAAATNDIGGFRASDTWTSFQDITHYNNFYEFSTDKEEVAPAAAKFETQRWKVSVEGLVRQPRIFDLEEILKIHPPEERIYRMRCVEGWSMVIPWVGFPLSKLNDQTQIFARWHHWSPRHGAARCHFHDMIKRLGGKRWRALHRLAYVAAIAGVIHYYMQVKADVRQPLAFAAVLAVLFAHRLLNYWRGPKAAPAIAIPTQ